MDARSSKAAVSRRRVEELHASLNHLLESLDAAELHGAAAYVSMALDTIQRDFPGLSESR